MVSIEAKNKIIEHLKLVGGSNLINLMIATKIVITHEAMKKIIFKLEDEGILNIEYGEYSHQYWITLNNNIREIKIN